MQYSTADPESSYVLYDCRQSSGALARYELKGHSLNIREIVNLTPVIPVVTVTDLAQALPIAQSLLRGGVTVIEVALRTPVAFAAVKAMRGRVFRMRSSGSVRSRELEISRPPTEPARNSA